MVISTGAEKSIQTAISTTSRFHNSTFKTHNSKLRVALDNFGSTLDKNGYVSDNFGNISAQFQNTKTPQNPISSLKASISPKRITINEICVICGLKNMQNEPNFKTSKIAISRFVSTPKASSLK